MERRGAIAGGFIIAAAVLLCATVAARDDIEDPGSFAGAWYRIVFDSSGNYVRGDGHGYGNGTWYHYPQTGWWRQWYYNEPFSTTRQGYLEYQVYIKPAQPGLPSSAEIRFNWSTPQWSGLRTSRPPLPGDAPSAGAEAKYMQSKSLFSIDNAYIGTVEPIATWTISEYNPEWVSIDIRGRNVYIYRGAFHACTAKDTPTGACYNSDTGQCYLCLEGDCPPAYEWLGAGTTCPDTPAPGTDPVPVYRLWSTAQSVHRYTTSEDERDRFLADPTETWIDEGTAWQVLTTPATTGCLPVYRFESNVRDAEFYTISEAERRMLTDKYAYAWTYTGVAFYAYPQDAPPADTTPVYRFWSGQLGHHFYTISQAERDSLIANYSYTWLYEGVAWYAYPP